MNILESKVQLVQEILNVEDIEVIETMSQTLHYLVLNHNEPCCYTLDEVKAIIPTRIAEIENGNYCTMAEVEEATKRWA